MTQMITTRKLIDANKAALASKMLTGFIGHGGCYMGENGTACAIGVAFDPSFLHKLTGTIHNVYRINMLVERSTAGGYIDVRVEDLAVAHFTQRLHDSWASRTRMTPHDYDTRFMRGISYRLEDFIRAYYNKPVTEEVFRAWIDLLDNEFPAEGAA